MPKFFNKVVKSASLATVAVFCLNMTATTAFANNNDNNNHNNQKVCETHTLAVHLIPNDPTNYNVVGELCWKGNLNHKTVQVLVHGATYDKSYWDFPYQNGKYSYVDYAVKNGYATFNYDRLGSGQSDKPLGVLVNVDNSAYVNHQVVQALRSGTFGENFHKVVLVGHSFGSLISVAAASTYHDVDALVLTGFAHQATAQANTGTQNSVYPAAFDPKFAGIITDNTYFTTIPGTRAGLFFNTNFTDPGVLTLDESLKDVMTLGLIFDIPRHFSTESLSINVPVYMIMGAEDFIYCGENVDCSDPSTYQTYEQGFFSVPVKTKIIPKAGHSLNLHKNSEKTFGAITKWIDHNVD